MPHVLPHARYYSADGRTVLILRSNPAALDLFDVSDPMHPRQLGATIENGAGILTRAVSGDGRVIAVGLDCTTTKRIQAYDLRFQQPDAKQEPPVDAPTGGSLFS